MQKEDLLLVTLQNEFDLLEKQEADGELPASIEDWLPDWYTSKLGSLDDIETRLEAQYKIMTAAVQRARQHLIATYEGPLRTVIDGQFADGKAGKKKSIPNQFGKIGYRKITGKLSVTVEEEDKAIAYLAFNVPNTVVTKRVIDKILLKKHFEQTGEDVPGIKFETGETYEKFFVEPAKLVLENKEGE